MELELRDNNLFANGKIIEFPKDEEGILTREPIVYVAKEGDIYHPVVEGDTLTKIAYRYYNSFVPDSSKYWWAIADVNFIYDPLDLTGLLGTEILIPDLARIKLNLSVTD